MKKLVIALTGVAVLTVGLLGCSQKAGATNRKRMTAYVPAKDPRFSYDEVTVESYRIQDGVIHIVADDGCIYIGNNIVIEKWSD